VSAGAGIVGANDVTDVSVDCSESEFFVRGKVVGLKSSIVLGNTDDAIAGSVDDTARDDAVAVSGDGDFHFMAPVRLGHRYDVTVLEQPSLPQQSCVVEDGRGLVTDGDVFVRIDCTEPTVQP
jgi:hypothetical protein